MYKCAVYNFKQPKDLGYLPMPTESVVESAGYLSTADLVRSILECGSVPASVNDPDKMAYDEIDGKPVDPDHPDLCTPVFSDKLDVLQHVKNKREKVQQAFEDFQSVVSAQQKQPASPQQKPASASVVASPSQNTSEAQKS